MKKWLHTNRFELLLLALMMVIFNKIFFFAPSFYSTCVWPANMVLLGIVSMGIFHENRMGIRLLKNVLFMGIIAVPLFAAIIFRSHTTSVLALTIYIFFYLIIFVELMRQIVQKSEVTESLIYGSLSGFLLLIIISAFSFLLIDKAEAGSFNHISGTTIPEKYHQFIYFSSVTISTIGYGDITPATDNARLLSAFWGVVGQFYMVAVVGIIISKYSSKS
jgi:hypothetical protein